MLALLTLALCTTAVSAYIAYSSKSQISKLETENTSLTQKNIEISEQLTEQIIETQRLHERLEITKDMQKHLKEMSATMIQENREQTLKESRNVISNLIDPLGKNILEFRNKIESLHKTDSSERIELKTALKNEVENIVKATSHIGNQAKGLADALKKPKMQGNWGEAILENILEASGLKNGIEYFPQGVGLDLRDSENKLAQPDIIIKLPSANEYVIVDAKTSLINYEAYYNSETEDIRNTHRDFFIRDIKKHVSDLSARRYQDVKSTTHDITFLDFVIMFMPIEGAYYMTQTHEMGKIHEEAWNRGVIIAGPYNFMAILKTISSCWRVENQNRNAEEIAKVAGEIYDKVVGIRDDIIAVEKDFRMVIKRFDDVKSKIGGHGGIASKMQKIAKLGIKGKKQALLTESGDDA
jgi:DNA recombination protein RmuC